MKYSLGKIPLALCLVGFAVAMTAPVQAARGGSSSFFFFPIDPKPVVSPS